MRPLLVTALVLLLAALVLSPATAAVRHWIGDALDAGQPPANLRALPTSGRLLVTASSGTWILRHDGSVHRLGSYATASWSPHGRFIVATGANILVALDPSGSARWTLARSHVTDAVWSLGDGYRIAYRSGTQLRIVGGDGTGDRVLASGTAAVTPAWRPGPRGVHTLAYATRSGSVILRDVDAIEVGTTVVRNDKVLRGLAWAGPDRLLVLDRGMLRVLDASGHQVRTVRLPMPGPFLTGMSPAPDGRSVALVRGGELWRVSLATGHGERIFAANGSPAGIAWSPDGTWLALGWPVADQWLFLHAVGDPRILSVSHVTRRLDAGKGAAEVRGFAGPGGIAGWAR